MANYIALEVSQARAATIELMNECDAVLAEVEGLDVEDYARLAEPLKARLRRLDAAARALGVVKDGRPLISY